MQIILLNSGTGKRLNDLTKNNPKCLLKINHSDSILSYQLKILTELKLNNLIITTGPFQEQIRETVKHFPSLVAQFIHNPLYDKSNYIYTLWLLKEYIFEDVILIHGDMVFEKTILQSLIDSSFENLVVINKNIPAPEKDFKATLIGSEVIAISIEPINSKQVALFPIYKLSKKTFFEWIEEIDLFIKDGEVNEYAESALNNLLVKNFKLNPLFTDAFCAEVDTKEDLKKVWDFFNKTKKS